MSKVWKVLAQESDDLITQLLLNRGIKSEEEKENFFNPKLENFDKELKIPGIEKAFKRIQKCIEGGELILVYGDYDVDGVTASAILYKGLSSLGAKVLPYIPHREREGYGLGKLGLEFARDSGATLVITVDNGIVAIAQAKYAKELGLDLIITDHHVPLEELPEAFAIVHSTKMCGAAVAWCLIRDYISESLKKELLQFVGIATVADMIPLVGLGRAFVKEGLKVLNKTQNPGLLALFEECGLKRGEIGGFEIGHVISPRINAIGRLEHAIDALRMLCTKDPIKAKRLAKLLADTNVRRQELTVKAYEEAKLLVVKEKKIHILHSENWNQGIIGLVAARICEEYYRPAIAISVNGEIAKGSARSANGLNIVEAIRKCSELLVDVGGHSGAAGFSIHPSNIEKFKLKLEEIVELELADELEDELLIEAEISKNKLTRKLADQIEEFEPFGFLNRTPILATKGMKLTDIRTLKEGKHLKFKAEGIDAIAFNMGELEKRFSTGDLIDIAYTLEINRFNGREILQLKVKDIKL